MASSSAALHRSPELPQAEPASDFVGTGVLGPSVLGTGVGSERRRGRGAHSNASGRFEPLASVAFDDGWQSLEELPPFKTTVAIDAARKVITRNDSPDISFDRSINPYRG